MATDTSTPHRQFARVTEIIDRYGRDPAHLIPILQAIQEDYRYLPEQIMNFVASALGISPARVFGVATFYSHFALEPKGKHVIRVCDGTACHVKGSMRLVDQLRALLGLTEKKTTTDDMLFTIETVSCLGACGLAPVMIINEQVYGQVTPEKAVAEIDALIAREGELQ
jgi:NADH-quinone oxidoreductase subunit E